MLSFAPMPPVPSLPPEEPIRPRPIRRKLALSPSQRLGILGSALLLVGLILPFERGSSSLVSGDLSEHGSGIAEAAVIAAMAALSFLLAMRQCCPALAMTAMIAQMALASAALLTIGPSAVSGSEPETIFCGPGPSFLERALFGAGKPHVQLGPGWYVLLLGPIVLLVAAVADDILDARSPRRQPVPEYRPPLDGPSPDCV